MSEKNSAVVDVVRIQISPEVREQIRRKLTDRHVCTCHLAGFMLRKMFGLANEAELTPAEVEMARRSQSMRNLFTAVRQAQAESQNHGLVQDEHLLSQFAPEMGCEVHNPNLVQIRPSNLQGMLNCVPAC